MIELMEIGKQDNKKRNRKSKMKLASEKNSQLLSLFPPFFLTCHIYFNPKTAPMCMLQMATNFV
jgi:hypothetical protein